jgi:RNA polymerase sigma-B factor
MTTLTSAHHADGRDRSGAAARESGRRDRDDRTTDLLRAAARTTGTARRRLLDQVVIENLGLADAVSHRYARRGVDAEELRQVAYLGLVAAAQRFDPDRGHDFASFAVPTMLGEVKRHFRDRVWAVRPPRRVQELRSAMTAAADELCQVLGATPSEDELAEHLGTDPAEIREAQQCGQYYAALSIDQAVSGAETEGLTLADVVGAAEAGYDHAEAIVALTTACRDLSSRDAHIVYRRYYCGWTQHEIGAEIGVTQMQVSRLLKRILGQLRTSIGGPVPDPVYARALRV